MKEGGSRFVFMSWLLLTAHQLSRDKMEKGGKKMEGQVLQGLCVPCRLPSWQAFPPGLLLVLEVRLWVWVPLIVMGLTSF